MQHRQSLFRLPKRLKKAWPKQWKRKIREKVHAVAQDKRTIQLRHKHIGLCTLDRKLYVVRGENHCNFKCPKLPTRVRSALKSTREPRAAHWNTITSNDLQAQNSSRQVHYSVSTVIQQLRHSKQFSLHALQATSKGRSFSSGAKAQRPRYSVELGKPCNCSNLVIACSRCESNQTKKVSLRSKCCHSTLTFSSDWASSQEFTKSRWTLILSQYSTTSAQFSSLWKQRYRRKAEISNKQKSYRAWQN